MGFPSFWRVAVSITFVLPEAERAVSWATLDSVLWGVKHSNETIKWRQICSGLMIGSTSCVQAELLCNLLFFLEVYIFN